MEHSCLYIALAVALLVIAWLVCAVLHYRRKLYHCQQAMVRCINENLDMKAKLPPGKQPHLFTSQEVSPKELTKIICNMLKKLMSVSVFFLLAIYPAIAQEKTDTVYTFRFVPENDRFYVPWNGNDRELERLETYVEQMKEYILAGEIPLYVDGHADKYTVAKTRSNRVKSELITRQGLKEENFVTQNHTDDEDYVTVMIKVAKPTVPFHRNEGIKDDSAQDTVTETQQTGTATQTAISTEVTTAAPNKKYTLSLRTNLLRWATLTPDFGIEWRITPSVGIAVNGSWTSWTWRDNDRRYALWEVAPEIRWYLGEMKRGYIGAMYKAGSFNYKLSAVGKQGDLMGGGIIGGYQLKLNSALSLDFNLAVGCLHANYEKYTVINGVCVRGNKESKNWWGPINAGITLVWRMVK